MLEAWLDFEVVFRYLYLFSLILRIECEREAPVSPVSAPPQLSVGMVGSLRLAIKFRIFNPKPTLPTDMTQRVSPGNDLCVEGNSGLFGLMKIEDSITTYFAGHIIGHRLHTYVLGPLCIFVREWPILYIILPM
jgi:hypothetical protein